MESRLRAPAEPQEITRNESVARQEPVALVGCGRWGRNILRDLLALGADVAVVDPSPEALCGATRLGACWTGEDVAELPAVRGAVVACPTTRHARAILSLARREIPIFCEKPLTADARCAKGLATALPGLLFGMDKWRHHPGIEALRECARSGEFGEVVGLETSRLQWGHPCPDIDTAWLLAPHDLAIARELLGGVPNPVSARGVPGARGLTSLVALLGEAPWMRMEVSTRASRFERSVRLHCEGGTLALCSDAPDVLCITPAAPDCVPGDAPVDRRAVPNAFDPPLARQLRAFLRHLDGGPAPPSSAAEAAEIVETVAALRHLALGPDR
jgi:predicted dehydrogenase